jgi:hypothetical protein
MGDAHLKTVMVVDGLPNFDIIGMRYFFAIHSEGDFFFYHGIW